MKVSTQKIKRLFHCKKIVVVPGMASGELVKVFTHKGKKFVRVGFTNRVKFKGTVPTTDILYSQVAGIRKLPSPIKTKVYALLNKKPRATYYKIQNHQK